MRSTAHLRARVEDLWRRTKIIGGLSEEMASKDDKLEPFAWNVFKLAQTLTFTVDEIVKELEQSNVNT